MGSFGDVLFEYLKIFLSAIVNVFEMLFFAFSTLLTASQSLVFIFRYMPPMISSACLFTLLVAILNYVVGRSNQ